MADLSSDPRSQPDADPRPAREPTTGTPPRVPRWVVVSGIVVGVLVLVFVVLQLTGLGGEHGPGRHLPGGGGPPASVTGAHTPPAGGH